LDGADKAAFPAIAAALTRLAAVVEQCWRPRPSPAEPRREAPSARRQAA
jgi:hypothetical protein